MRLEIAVVFAGTIGVVLVKTSHSQQISFGEGERLAKTRKKCSSSTQCIPVTSCPSASQMVNDGQAQPCGFKKKIPLICCNNIGESISSFPETKSQSIGISAPGGNFDCGRTSTREVIRKTRESGTSDGGVLIRRRRVVGGRPSPPSTLWPWLALVGEKDVKGDFQWRCVGSVLNNRWIITAAHCFLRHDLNLIRLGEYDYSDPHDGAITQDINVEEVILHPNFTFPNNHDDIALLRITNNTHLMDWIMPVCLAWGEESSTEVTGRNLLLTGWGTTIFGGEKSPILNEVNMPVLASSVCNDSYSQLRSFSLDYPRGIDDNFLCMGHPNGGLSACQGDSGGPLMYLNQEGKYVLAGLVSSGNGCGSPMYPGVHTNVMLDSRLAWIKEVAFA